MATKNNYAYNDNDDVKVKAANYNKHRQIIRKLIPIKSSPLHTSSISGFQIQYQWFPSPESF